MGIVPARAGRGACIDNRFESVSNPAMRKIFPVRCLAVAFVAALPSLAAAECPPPVRQEVPPEQRSRLSAKFPPGFEERRQVIDERLCAGQLPDWAGHYYQGPELNNDHDLALAPDAGATMTLRSIFGYVDINHGAVIVSPDGVIRIRYVEPNERKIYNEPGTFKIFPDEFVPIAWSGRQYLIPPDRLAEFISAINHGDEPSRSRRGRFLLREGDDRKPVTGLPAMPPFVQAHVRREPVEVRVTSVERTWHTERDGGCADRFRLHVVPLAAADPPCSSESN